MYLYIFVFVPALEPSFNRGIQIIYIMFVRAFGTRPFVPCPCSLEVPLRPLKGDIFQKCAQFHVGWRVQDVSMSCDTPAPGSRHPTRKNSD